MSEGNGPVNTPTGTAAIEAIRSGARGRAAPPIGRPPDPRFPPSLLLRLAIASAVLPLVLWVLLAIPRALEIAGAAEGSGEGPGEDLYVGAMLAAISVVVSALAVIVTTFAHSEISERIRIEREETEGLKPPMEKAETAAVRAAEERNRAFGATDALPGVFADQLNAIREHYWERFYVRHAEDPEVYGTWDDKETLKHRFDERFDSLFNTPDMLEPKELEDLIASKRLERANFRDTRVNGDGR